MTREEYIKWCENCVFREPSKIGIICSITNEYANFSNSCSNFSIDEKETRLNEERYLLLKYSEFRTTIIKTEQKVYWNIWSKKNLPERTVIKNQDKRKQYYLFILFSLIPIAGGFSQFLFQKNVNMESYYLISIGFLTIVILLYMNNKYKRDETVILEFDKYGISYNGLPKFSWKEIQTFELQEGRGRFTYFKLIIKPLLKDEIVIDLTYLESTPSKIIRSIERYKEMP